MRGIIVAVSAVTLRQRPYPCPQRRASIAFSSDRKYLFDEETCSPRRGVLAGCDPSTGKLALPFVPPRNDHDIFASAMSPNGSRAAVIGTEIALKDYRRIRPERLTSMPRRSDPSELALEARPRLRWG